MRSRILLTADSDDSTQGTETVRAEAPPGYVFQNVKGLSGATGGSIIEGTASSTVDFAAEMVKGASSSGGDAKKESPTLTGLVVIACAAAIAMALPRRS